MEGMKYKKQIVILIIIILLVVSGFVLPTFSAYKNRSEGLTPTVWDGDMASGYRLGDGTKNNPYVISNGAEFKYFQKMLEVTDYAGKFFTLGNDLLLNEGIFLVEDDKIVYKINDIKYYVKEYTNEYYDNSNFEGSPVGMVNTLPNLDKFSGSFDGAFHTIFGMYTYSLEDNVGIFKELNGGSITNVSLTNTLVQGGLVTGGVVAIANNATISNVSFNGFVLGRKDVFQEMVIEDITSSGSLSWPDEMMSVKEAFLEGTCQNDFLVNDTTVVCDGNSFKVEIPEASWQLTLTEDNYLTNLKYTYLNGDIVTSGIVGKASSLNMDKIVQKAKVDGFYSAGILGIGKEEMVLQNLYNVGVISGVRKASGIILEVSGGTSSKSLENVYNDGKLLADTKIGLIDLVDDSGKLSILNAINYQEVDFLLENIESEVNLENVYAVNGGMPSAYEGLVTGKINLQTRDNLLDKNFLVNELNFKEDIWVYKNGEVPTLKIDDVNKSTGMLVIDGHSWQDFKDSEDVIYASSNVLFSVDAISNVQPIKASYFVSSDSLSLEEIKKDVIWEEYNDVVTLSQEGNYYIYVMVEDISGYKKYIKSEKIVIDKTLPLVQIVGDGYTWSDTESLGTIYIDQQKSFEIIGDDLSQVSSISYAISDKVVNSWEELSWQNYLEPIEILEYGKYILYAKVVDGAGNVGYARSDTIFYGGYLLSNLYVGNTPVMDEEVSITKNSSVTYQFSYEINGEENLGKRKLEFNQNIPVGTKITLMDLENNETYVLKVSVSKKDFWFSDFVEIGKSVMADSFDDNVSTNLENYKIVVDFSQANIENDILGLILKINLVDDNEEVIRPSLISSLKQVNVLVLKNPTLNISLVDGISEINISKGTSFILPIKGEVNYEMDEGLKVYDTDLQKYLWGLEIKLTLLNGKSYDKDTLKKIKISVGENNYFPDQEGIWKIALSREENLLENIKITSYDGTKLFDKAQIMIKGIYSYDGKFGGIESNTISLPIVSEGENIIKDSDFNVISNNENVFFRKDGIKNLEFMISKNEDNLNTRVGVALYQKSLFTAYNQDYHIVDLQDFTSSFLNSIDNMIYEVDGSSLSLPVMMENLSPGGYKLVFSFYQGDKIICEVQKVFIVR